jgi:hypothetical protein
MRQIEGNLKKCSGTNDYAFNIISAQLPRNAASSTGRCNAICAPAGTDRNLLGIALAIERLFGKLPAPRAETTDSASEYSNRPILRAMRLYSSRELMVRKLETIPLATRNF